jgi:hypothetical protein
MSNTAKIIEVAALVREVDNGAPPDRLEYELARLSPQELMLVTFAGKMMEGKQYRVCSDNPETIRRCLAVAKEMGATVIEEDGRGVWGAGIGNRTIRFVPAQTH